MLSQNVQNIRGSHKLHRENYENLESGIDSRRGKLSWRKDPKSYIPRRYPITDTTHNCHDATQPHTLEIHSGIQTLSIAGKDKSPNVYGRIKLFAKNEKELETLIHTVWIYSEAIGMEFGIEKCAILVMKSGKRILTDGKELPNQNKIRTLQEKETYKYLGILEADAIKQVEMKRKN